MLPVPFILERSSQSTTPFFASHLFCLSTPGHKERLSLFAMQNKRERSSLMLAIKRNDQQAFLLCKSEKEKKKRKVKQVRCREYGWHGVIHRKLASTRILCACVCVCMRACVACDVAPACKFVVTFTGLPFTRAVVIRR